MSLSPFCNANKDQGALEALAEYLQEETEERSRVLARDLHDDLGGSLIAVMMDLAWLSRHPCTDPADASVRFHRMDAGLTKAIECTRRLVDELRPALLDSLGLFVAISAHFARECARYGIEYGEIVAGTEPDLDSESALTAFRIAQEFLHWMREDAGAKALQARFQGDSERLIMRFVAQGMPTDTIPNPPLVEGRLASIALRLRKLNGTLSSEASGGSMTIHVEIPVDASRPKVAA